MRTFLADLNQMVMVVIMIMTIMMMMIVAEVRFVTAVSAGGSVKFLQAV